MKKSDRVYILFPTKIGENYICSVCNTPMKITGVKKNIDIHGRGNESYILECLNCRAYSVIPYKFMD